MKNLTTLTVGELRELLSDYDEDTKVIFTTDYGDFHHTPQALAIAPEAEEGYVAESAYSNSGFQLVADDDEDVEGERADVGEKYLVLRDKLRY